MGVVWIYLNTFHFLHQGGIGFLASEQHYIKKVGFHARCHGVPPGATGAAHMKILQMRLHTLNLHVAPLCSV